MQGDGFARERTGKPKIKRLLGRHMHNRHLKTYKRIITLLTAFVIETELTFRYTRSQITQVILLS